VFLDSVIQWNNGKVNGNGHGSNIISTVGKSVVAA
jgi:hypothetical protein